MALMDQTDPSDAAYEAAVSSGDLSRLFAVLEREQGLPAGYLARTAQIESGMNPNATNPRSSATGLFQFIDSTGSRFGLANRQDRLDPVQSTLAAAQLAGENADTLRGRLGRDPSAGELYLAHQQGAGGASAMLVNPNAPASAVLGERAAALNGGSGLTAGQMASRFTSRFGEPAMASASAAPMPAISGGSGSDTMMGGSGSDQMRPGLMNQPYQPAGDGFDAGNLLGAIGQALLSGTRQNPLGTLPKILQAQQEAANRREDRRYGMYRDNRDFAFRQTESERAQGNTDRGYGLQSQQLDLSKTNAERSASNEAERIKIAREAADKSEKRLLPDGSLVSVDDDGTVKQLTPPIKTLNEVDRRKQDADAMGLTGETRSNYILNGKYDPNSGVSLNPYANPGGGKTTGEQDKSAGFADRMFQNEQTVRQHEGEGTSMLGRAASAIPGVGRLATSEGFKKFDDAKQNWIAAQLRKESGAAIGQSEYTAADRQYFPQPGDTPDILAQKRELRRTATEGMARDGGPGYRPKLIFGQDGALQPYVPSRQQTQGGAQAPQAGAPASAGSEPKPAPQARFDALTGSGLTKEQAYAKMREEGY